MNKTVFISSTFVDLKEERKEVWELLKKYDVLVRGMEQFGARKEDSLTTCITEVEQSDIYVGIIGYRLGSIDNKTGKSYTQLEYDKALELGKEILIYIIDDESSKVSPKYIEFDKIPKLNSFKDTLKERHTIDTFKDSEELKQKLSRQFEKYLTKKEAEKKTKTKDDFSQSKLTLEKFFLVPKAISGAEVKLRVKFDKTISPASKAICQITNMDFGKTTCANIRIVEPNIDAENFKSIIIGFKKLDDYLKLDKNKEYVIYGNVWFHENKIKSITTRFKDISYQIWDDDYYYGQEHQNQEEPQPFVVKKEIGEGQIVLTLKEIEK
ncbi:DUF4062 domain-containing protein [Reichenbachiella ulvae]|uniref:DUF4062 domain-containing protein n=1 Tax=Reichenbachiella ulvae TaxID=2980104 RepID=A0ABT3CPZ8_9BACT|nr:DUF4062 domain-containing protein [Reichenbachiella ulvae]MCV9385530.1 DUF4062 domain-containing protein [Reichenbachiella ulvae]